MSDATSHDRNVKRLIWLYFWLLMFEGALRKWVLPSLSTPLLIIRDPVVLLIYALAASKGKFPRNFFIVTTFILAFLSFMTSFLGRGTLMITIFGIHANFLHLPLIFLIPAYFDAGDARKIGRWILLLLIPMTVLVVMQFRAAPDSRLNAGAGGEIGGQLWVAENKVRPSGLFSFVTGMVSYLSLCSAFVLYHFLQKRVYNLIFIWTTVACLVLSLGVSGSRSAVMASSVVIIATLVVALLQPSRFGRMLWALLIIYLAFAILSETMVFQEGLSVHQGRFVGGGGLQEGIVYRFFSGFTDSIWAAMTAPFLGYGLGVGTNVGAAAIQGARGFLLAEGEWARVVLEIGSILGYAYILLRGSILFFIARTAWRSLMRGYVAPWLLVAASGLDILIGQFGQATALGFAVFGGGLALSAARVKEDEMQEPVVEKTAPKVLRGRSAYAETLHEPSVS